MDDSIAYGVKMSKLIDDVNKDLHKEEMNTDTNIELEKEVKL